MKALNTMARPIMLLLVLGLSLFWTENAKAHCDTMDGPVVKDARLALDKKDVTPVLKWIRANDEQELKNAFQRALGVRSGGPEAKELADLYFFETAVRLHRASEGMPFTGLKPAGSSEGSTVIMTDAALESGSIDLVAGRVTEHIRTALLERFAHAREARAHAAESVEAGRAYVEAYIAYTHFVEEIHAAAMGTSHSDGTQKAAAPHEH